MSSANPPGTPVEVSTVASAPRVKRPRKSTRAQLTRQVCIKHLLTQSAPAAKAAELDSAGPARASKRPKINGHADVTTEPDNPSSTPQPLDTTLMELARSAVVHYLTEEEKNIGKTVWLMEKAIIEHLFKERWQPEYFMFFKDLTEGEVRASLRGVFDSEEERPASDRKLYRGAPQVEGVPLDKNATY
ncbi:hypothetical protein LTR22_028418, partial [Elasticomyces elasticus]